MSDDAFPLEGVLQLREAEIEAARFALARAERALEEAKAHRKQIARTLEVLVDRRSEECAAFDRQVGAAGARVAELTLFEERLSGLDAEERRHRRDLEEAEAQVSLAARAASASRHRLQERLAEREALDRRRAAWQEHRKEEAEREEWDERDALAARRKPKPS